MTNSIRAVVVATLLLVATACGDANAPAASAPEVSATAASTTVPSSAAAPGLATANVYKLGQTVTLPDDSADVTVFGYRQPIDSVRGLNPGMVWSAAEVRVCLSKVLSEQVRVSEEPWTLVYPDGGIYEPTKITYRDFPAPEYPKGDGRTTLPGRCVRGWIVFQTPKEEKPQYVEYAPDLVPVPIDWQIS